MFDLKSLAGTQQMLDSNKDKLQKSAFYFFFLASNSQEEAALDSSILFGHSFFNKAINAVLFSLTAKGTIHVHIKEIKPQDYQQSGKPYDFWNGERFLFNKDLFPDKLQDLGGKVLKATTFNFAPYTYQEDGGSYGGWEYHVMTSIANNMNFQLDINPPPNGELWGENKNGTFTGKTCCLN